jgi:hypothetical protein
MTYILPRGRYPIVCTVGVVVSPIGYYYREPVYFKCTKTFYGVLFLPVCTHVCLGTGYPVQLCLVQILPGPIIQ